MTEEARVRFHLDTGDAEIRTARFAMDSATVREAYRGLPADLRMAHTEMLRLGSQQVRMGHLRYQERQQLAIYQERQAQHTERLARTISGLSRSTAAHPSASRYAELLRQGGGALARAVGSDAGLADLHAQMTDLNAARGQRAAIDGTNQHLDRYGVSSEWSWGRGASYWGRRAMFGAESDGTPLTAGQWATRGAQNTVGRVKGAINTATSMFTLFEGIQMLTRSMSAFEQKALTVQEIGSKLGGTVMEVGDAFDYVEGVISGRKVSGREAWAMGLRKNGGKEGRTAWVGGLRKDFGYTLAQIGPGLREMAKYQGNLDGSHAALRIGRGTGIGPAALGIFGRMGMYGAVDGDLIERLLRSSGMRNRPEAAMGWLASMQAQLGSGYYRVPSDAPARYMQFITDAMGEGFRNQRGADLAQRLIGGMRAPGSGALYASKMHAVSGLGRLDLGGGRVIDTSTYRGMRAALESGDPRVLEALFAEAQRLGGRGDLGREMFQSLLGGSTNIFESDMLFDRLDKAGGKMPTSGRIRQSPNLDDDLAAVRHQNNPAWNIQKTAAAMETDVYERVGAVLRPITVDFQTAALKLADRMAESADGLSLAANMLAGVGDAITYLRHDANPAAHAIFELSLLSGSGATILVKEVLSAALQTYGAATK